MKRICSLLMLFVLTSCTDHTLDSLDYPRIHTSRVEASAGGGATFFGAYLLPGKSAVTDHGFLWDVTFPDIRTSHKISLGAMDSPGDYQAKVSDGLTPGRDYTVRTYAITSEYTVYGESITFTAK